VTLRDGVDLGAVGEHVVPEGAHGLAEAIAVERSRVVERHHRLRDETTERVEHVERVNDVVTRHRFGRLEREGAGEHRQTCEHRLLALVEQPERPLHRGAQRLVTSPRGTAPVREETEPLVEPTEDGRRAHRGGARGGELDREREAVEPAAELVDGLAILRGHLEPVTRRGGAIDEQLRRRLDGERANRVGGLAVDGETLLAGGEHRDVRAAAYELVDDPRGDVHDVLAVVEHEEQAPVREDAGQRLLRRRAQVLEQADRGGDLGGDEVGVADGRQVDEPRAVGVVRQHRCRGLYREARLAHAAGPGERDEPLASEQVRDRVEVIVAADERAHVRREIRGIRVESAQRRELGA
jgi:hypothetical protein